MWLFVEGSIVFKVLKINSSCKDAVSFFQNLSKNRQFYSIKRQI